MHAKTEELLYLLLWAAEMISRPTFRNLNESFEGWAYRRGFVRQLDRLEKQQWLERHPGPKGERLHRLTAAGRLQALGGRDPESHWKRRWDRYWRLVLFDVPESRSSTRNTLRRYLRARGFGYLQNSVWITPHPVSELRSLLADGPVDVESLLLLEARPCAGETEAQIVAGAWDFAEINARYAEHQEILRQRPPAALDSDGAAKDFQRWLGEERQAWAEAIGNDPLLPTSLLPDGYSGRKAWKARQAAMQKAGKQIRSFEIPDK